MSAARKARRAILVHGRIGRMRRKAYGRRGVELPADVRYARVFHPDGSITELRKLPTGRRELRALLASRSILLKPSGSDRHERRKSAALYRRAS